MGKISGSNRIETEVAHQSIIVGGGDHHRIMMATMDRHRAVIMIIMAIIVAVVDGVEVAITVGIIVAGAATVHPHSAVAIVAVVAAVEAVIAHAVAIRAAVAVHHHHHRRTVLLLHHMARIRTSIAPAAPNPISNSHATRRGESVLIYKRRNSFPVDALTDPVMICHPRMIRARRVRCSWAIWIDH